ncbi:beta-fructofuranosidase, cell wall isozyme-like isoform X2 [Juglans microcarpa x Juglans regia]|uniref:beta-fructofuranosidase, cell wall isozyme-like isoform X2 n=1 Tax=Juglans microcarpa x Juglans regia TaxID=2249226 RepID=UPI001B7E88F5|nr:beta-fructofuranosidase, cell wall isozyme-like isoform X2 [Juglans microcarpa x Juglans regia]
MALSCIWLMFFFSLFGHGVLELIEAFHHVYLNVHQTAQYSTSGNQPYRTSYHFQPPNNWMNDPNGPMLRLGIYHLFYQYNPKAAVWGSNLIWGHSTSTDLVNWTPHDPAIYPSQQSDINGCWSGSATILPGGHPVILYTGIDPENRQVQNLAAPKNFSDPFLREWVKFKHNPLLTPNSKNKINATYFRDPSTAWLGSDGNWRVIIGSQKKERGLAILFKSNDFVHWEEAEKPLYSANKDTGMWECPDFYPVLFKSPLGIDTSSNGPDVRYVLKVSFFRTPHDYYMIGTYNPDKDIFIPDNGPFKDSSLRYDYGKFYASKTFFDDKYPLHRRILWGWVNESSSAIDDIKKGWSGVQAIPRSIWLDKSGKQLLQWPIKEIETLRGTQIELPYQVLSGGSVLEVSGLTAAQADVVISFEISDFIKAEVLDSSWTNPQVICSRKDAIVKGGLGPFGLLVLASEGLQEYTAVFYRIFKGHNKYVVLMCSDQSRLITLSWRALVQKERLASQLGFILHWPLMMLRLTCMFSIMELRILGSPD